MTHCCHKQQKLMEDPQIAYMQSCEHKCDEEVTTDN